MNHLTTRDIIALGFMTFALFVGAGNIIFPPMVGLQSGDNVWIASVGFLITAVGLPVITVIALARVGGGVEALSSPIGKNAGLVLATICYLSVGPLFATPRTTTVSFELGIAPLVGNSELSLFIYSLIYFALVILVSLYPGKLLDSVGRILAPLKIISLSVLGIAALLWPAGQPMPAIDIYQKTPFSKGFVEGYLTMDTLGALVFGVVIVNAARSRGITSKHLLTRYTIIAGLIAGIGLTLVYLSLFNLGATSGSLVPNATNGAEVLHAYIQQTFGNYGSLFLAILIFVACMVTAIGLTCACAEFFSKLVPLTNRQLVFILAIFSMVVSNLGLSHLIKFSIPVLTAIYPPCIALVVLSFTSRMWRSESRIMIPVMLVTSLVGILDGIKASALADILPVWNNALPVQQQKFAWILHQFEQIPGAEQGLTWLPFAIVVLIIAAIVDRIMPKLAETTSIEPD